MSGHHIMVRCNGDAVSQCWGPGAAICVLRYFCICYKFYMPGQGQLVKIGFSVKNNIIYNCIFELLLSKLYGNKSIVSIDITLIVNFFVSFNIYSPQGLVDGLQCKLGSLSDLFTAQGSNYPGRTVGQSYSQAVGTFLCVRCISFHFLSFPLAFFRCFWSLFQSYCSNAPVFGRTLVQEFHIVYSLTEWNFLFSLFCMGSTLFWLANTF